MNEIKRLLVVSSTYPVNDEDKVPRFVYDQVRSFNKHDPALKIDVLSPHNQASNYTFTKKDELPNVNEHRFHYFIPRYERLTDRGIIPALSVNKLNYLLLPFLILAEFFAILVLAIRTKPDIIYAHWFTPQAISAGIVSFITRIPYGYTTHASDVDVWRRFGPLGILIVRLFSRKATVITAVSSQTSLKLERFFTTPPKVHIIPMGICLPKNPNTKPDPKKALFIGRLTEKKGLHYLFPAIKRIIDEHPDFKLTVAGDGEERDKLELQVKKLELENHITFTGFVSGAKKDSLLKNHGLMLVPSIVTKSGDAEGLPVSLMEGLSHGMAIVATDVTGAKDIIIHGENGFIVKSESSEALHEQISSVLSLKTRQFEELSVRTFKSANKISWPLISERHLKVFSEALLKQ